MPPSRFMDSRLLFNLVLCSQLRRSPAITQPRILRTRAVLRLIQLRILPTSAHNPLRPMTAGPLIRAGFITPTPSMNRTFIDRWWCGPRRNRRRPRMRLHTARARGEQVSTETVITDDRLGSRSQSWQAVQALGRQSERWPAAVKVLESELWPAARAGLFTTA